MIKNYYNLFNEIKWEAFDNHFKRNYIFES